jgi:sortase (surface protein transpeptidase)
VVLAASAGAVILFTPGNDDASAESPALVGTVASSTTLPRSSTTTLALSQPENPPEDEYADVPVVEIGSIEIPRIGLATSVYEGIWLTVLDVGPGHTITLFACHPPGSAVSRYVVFGTLVSSPRPGSQPESG